MSEDKGQLWAGRASGQVADITVRMGESISLDVELYREAIRGSVAPARMLRKMGIVSGEELSAIEEGLRQVRREIEAGILPLRPELEDIHTHVEQRLTELAGEGGRKLHTARSRNDQVAVDTHLFVRRACGEIAGEILLLCEALLERASQQTGTVLPGYTHLQVAQPIRLSHHLMAHFWSFSRDLERFARAGRNAERLPLGSGAMAGVNYENDREFLKEELGFRELYPNSMDAVSTRDHILEFLFAAGVFASHASRLAEELILWNSVEFGFISLPDSLTTGSSIMPQKKNPDLAELSRGKSGRVQSHLVNLLVNLKALPLTYNRDLQEDRFPLLDTRTQSLMIAEALRLMIAGAEFHAQRMRASLERGFATATDLADALVSEKNVAFREAHHIVGNLVRVCAERSFTLGEVPQEVRAEVSPYFGDDTFYSRAVSLERSADKKVSRGGTSLRQLGIQSEEARTVLESWRQHDWNTPDLDF